MLDAEAETEMKIRKGFLFGDIWTEMVDNSNNVADNLFI